MPEPKSDSTNLGEAVSGHAQDAGLSWATVESGQGLSRQKLRELKAQSKRRARGALGRMTLPVRRRLNAAKTSTPAYLSAHDKPKKFRSARWQLDPEHDELYGYVVTEDCFDDFLEPNSPGTIAHRKHFGDDTQFRGLRQLEEWLLENGLVRHEEFEGLGCTDKILKVLSTKGKVIEQPFLFPHPEEILFADMSTASRPTPVSEDSFYFRFATDPETRGFALRNFIPSAWSPIAELIGPSPNDLKEAHLRDLFHAGHWEGKIKWENDRPVEEKVDPNLRVVAFLAMRGLTTKEQLERVYPFMEPKDFASYLSKVYQAVESTLPELFRRFIKFWDGLDLDGNELPYEDRLTDRQKEVMALIHFHGLSQADIARRDGNAESTISEHVDKAEEKFMKCFRLPHMRECRGNLPDGRTYFSALEQAPDSTDDGFYRRSSNKPGHVYAIDPTTGDCLGLWKEPAYPASKPRALISRRNAREWSEWKRPKYRTVPRLPKPASGLTTRLRPGEAQHESAAPLASALPAI